MSRRTCFSRRWRRSTGAAIASATARGTTTARSLACAPAGRFYAVGVAYSVCEVEAVPDEPHDQRLDFILTESELIDARDFG